MPEALTRPRSDLKVLLLSDGRPGHFNLSEGIVAAMQRLRPVTIARLDVRRRRRLSGHVAAVAIGMGASPAAVLWLAHGITPESLPLADAVISAGAETLPANIAAARHFGVPNIFYGSLRSFRSAWFSLVLTSYASQVRTPHPVMTLKPSRFDPDTLPTRPWTDVGGSPMPPRPAGLLIGGDGGGSRFAAADWDGLFDMLSACHAAWGTRWIVATSRRTPSSIGDRLATLTAQPNSPVQRFIDVRAAGTGTLTELFAASGMIAVTADSSSMLSEAVWSRRPVLALAPARHVLTPLETAYRQQLEATSHCRTLAIAQASPAQMHAALTTVHPLAHNPLEQLAGLLASRLPDILSAATPALPR